MKRKKKKISKIQPVLTWIRQHSRLTMLIAGSVLIVGVSLVAFAVLNQRAVEVKPTKSSIVTVKKPVSVVKYYSNLTGAEVNDKATADQAVTAIMLENSPSARPQSGIKDAGVVFEAIAEGGITRFLTLFQENKPELIGPVRSVRMYFVDWVAAFDASVAHVGGSREALNELRNGNYRDIDQFFNGGTYWRSSDRYAPHNVYTNFKNLDSLNVQKGYLTSKFTGFPRVNEKPIAQPTATQINIDFSSATYNTSYSYDKNQNSYNRNMGGEPHVDREKGQLSPKVVIAMKVNESTVLEDGYREQIQTIGSGEVVIFQNGQVVQGTWSKKDRASQLVFTDAAGKPIELVRGQTWISAIPNGRGGVSWQ